MVIVNITDNLSVKITILHSSYWVYIIGIVDWQTLCDAVILWLCLRTRASRGGVAQQLVVCVCTSIGMSWVSTHIAVFPTIINMNIKIIIDTCTRIILSVVIIRISIILITTEMIIFWLIVIYTSTIVNAKADRIADTHTSIIIIITATIIVLTKANVIIAICYRDNITLLHLRQHAFRFIRQLVWFAGAAQDSRKIVEAIGQWVRNGRVDLMRRGNVTRTDEYTSFCLWGPNSIEANRML